VVTRVDCWAENRAAIESSRDANHNAYVPECMPDGRFQVVQCYKVRLQAVDRTTKWQCRVL
jgi:hypothetical protein